MLHFAGEQRGGPVQPGAAHPGRARRHRPQHLPRPPRLGRPQGPPAHGQQQRQPQEVHPGQGAELEIAGHEMVVILKLIFQCTVMLIGLFFACTLTPLWL